MNRFAVAVWLLVWASACTGSPPAIGNEESPIRDVSLHLMLRFHEDGGIDLEGATEVPGRSVVSNRGSGDWVVEVAAGGRTIAAQNVIDPFETRGLAEPDPNHHEGRSTAASMMVRVPGIGLASAEIESLEVRLVRVRSGAREVVASAPPGSLGQAIREKGTRAAP